MALTSGTRLGPYEIVSALGAGGMGEVYRARDTKLGRDVAIKVLPDLFASDPERLARFQREAQVLASLNHPNIAHIHGLEESGGVRALVMELVEGEDLAQRIARGAIPLDEVLPIATQVADALEAAHEQGIVHRDLKPANIKVRDDGTVKVLDFGLAKAMEPAAGASPSLSMSPTITTPAMTQAGMILGTAAYMSPEQAKGRATDKRCDVWAFGCVLYEMLTGKRAFEGEDVSDTLANVLKVAPDWAALPTPVRVPLRTLLTMCLEKDRAKRMGDIAVAQFLLGDHATGSSTSAAMHARPLAPTWRRAAPWAVTVAAVGLAAAVFMLWAPWRRAAAVVPVRFSIVPAPAQPFNRNNFYRNVAISPDATHVVFVAQSGGDSQLMVRAIDQLDPAPLRGISPVGSPFVSPDGRWVGFFTGAGGELKKVSINGGPPITLCRYSGNARGASWGSDGTIVFASQDQTTGLLSVPEGGGEPRVLTKPDTAHGEQDHLFPSVLPGGKGVLFTISAVSGPDNAQVAVLDLKTGQRKTLIRGGSHAEYVDPGYLVYASTGTLRAVRFDLARLDVLSDPVPVVEQVMTLGTGAAEFDVSRTGALVYVPGGENAGVGAPRSLVWVDRRGREEAVAAPVRAYVFPRLSPDGTRIAVDIRDQENDVWTWDLSRKTLTRLTFNPGADVFPIWTPDAKRIVFASTRAGVQNLYWQAADGTGTPERLTTSPNIQNPHSFSPDAKNLIVQENVPVTNNDLRVLRMDGPSTGSGAGKLETQPLIHTTFPENAGEISPDGRWLAYYSNESGQQQVYVRPFPNVDGGRWQISTAGGRMPAWAKNGRELFYLDASTTMMVVPVQTTPTFSAGNPSKLFDGRWYIGQTGRTYDVSSDGQRFLMIKDVAAGDQTAASLTMTVVGHWIEELKARVPTTK